MISIFCSLFVANTQMKDLSSRQKYLVDERVKVAETPHERIKVAETPSGL